MGGRPRARAAASVCLIDTARGAVLLGRRLRPPLQGAWAFPGGSKEPGEGLEDAARRELVEETGIEVAGQPVGRHVAWAGEGERLYRITCFVFECANGPEPKPSGELEAQWVAFEEALRLQPITAGTLAVLQAVLP